MLKRGDGSRIGGRLDINDSSRVYPSHVNTYYLMHDRLTHVLDIFASKYIKSKHSAVRIVYQRRGRHLCGLNVLLDGCVRHPFKL
jgi:hypothetical protein